ncbi:TlpA family protein disulfide reductase [Winogradskyella algicola]|uniref:TlpA family protein disulfide reductase n=1 Tax=Winogradskyella algicola TaxID=2575815 RepID=UPI001FEB7F3C|nr:TlpA disulfide reductase family protein [Winogradskyella algicola]
MKKHFKKSNIVFIIVILLLIIPQTRQLIQVWLHRGLSYINQSTIIDNDQRVKVTYNKWKLQSDNNTILDFRSTKGDVVFINFWATWCPPCIAEMPSLQALYDDYNNKVEFLFVTNDKINVVNNFKSKNGFNFKVYNPINEVPDVLATNSIPRTFIINKNHEIVVDESGALDWNSEKIRQLLDDLLIE